jgi:ferric-dicitrate binding protein FerR (iron transport regulator)
MLQDSPQPAIDELLVKFLLGEASKEEASEAGNWIAASPENQRYFAEFKMIWESSRELAARSTVNVEAAWERMKGKIEEREKRGTEEKTGEREKGGIEGKSLLRRMGIEWRRAAAILVVVLAGTITWLIYRQWTSSDQIEIASTNESRKEALPDGSVITMNKGTSVRYPARFSGNKRTVELKGEAFFDVKPDFRKPFEVTVNELTITVLGTSFNIRESDTATVIIVETGLVRVSDGEQVIELAKGEKTTIRKNIRTWLKDNQSDKLYQYYRTRSFNCDNTPLWKLVEVLNEAYDTNIVISNPAIKNTPITTVFEDQPLEEILSIIGQTLDITITRKDDIIYVQ